MSEQQGSVVTRRHEPGRQGRLVSLVRRHPLASFLAWFFTVGQALVFVPLLLRAHGVTVGTEPFIIAATWLGLLLPAVTIQRLSGGRAGSGPLLADAVRVRVRGRWYLLALLAVPAGVVALPWLDQGAPRATPAEWSTALVVGFLVNTAVVFVTVNWAEEVAWTGFVQGALRRRGWSPLRVAAAAGPLFALGHVSLVLGDGLANGAVLLLLVMVLSVPFRALQGWIHDRTHSLVLPGLVHAAGNAAALGSVAGEGLVPRLFGSDGQSVLVFAAFGLLAIAATRGRLSNGVVRHQGLEPRTR